MLLYLFYLAISWEDESPPNGLFPFLAKRTNILKKNEAVFTVLSSNFKHLQRLKYKIPEKWLSEFQSCVFYPVLAPLKLKVEVNTLKKKQDVLNQL